jgi:hypothetical protein
MMIRCAIANMTNVGENNNIRKKIALRKRNLSLTDGISISFFSCHHVPKESITDNLT